MSYTEREFEAFKANELKPEDTFQFECAMCGDCSRKRSEPILLTGADIFRAACALGTSIENTIAQNTEGYIGSDSHVPVIVLKERLDGSCRLLRKGRCMIQDNKPAVCALFPLGRYFDSQNQTFHYFMNPYGCQNGQKSGKIWTLQEWLDLFRIEETEKMTAAWHKLLSGIAQVTHKMDRDKIQGELLNALLGVLYLNYNTQQPYIEQVEHNMRFAQEIFRSKFHKNITF